jgi:hypothetical protein
MPDLESQDLGSSQDIDVDALLASIESPDQAVPDATTVPEGDADASTAPPPTPQAEALHKLTRNGITKDFPLSKVLQFAQQGWDYSQKNEEFNKRQQEFETQSKEHNQALERLKTYQQLEDYIKQDPQWWEHIRSAYESRAQGLEQGGVNSTSLQKVVDEQVSKAVEPFKKFFEAQERSKQDAALDQEIQGYRDRFPDFDWNTTDDLGRSVLVQQILEHAVGNSIGTFRAAANDFLHDQFLKRTELKSREKVSQELKKQTKLGLGPVTNQPVTDIKRVKNVAASSYDDITEEAMRELGIA